MSIDSTGGMSRRGFVCGASALAAAGLTGASLAGDATVAKADEAAADPEDDLGDAAPIEPVAVPQAWDGEADVVWVGTGAAGCVGPWKAATDGLSVIVLEKSSSFGGTSIETNIFAVSGTKVQIAAGGDPFDLETAMTSAANSQGFGTKMNRQLLAQILPRIPECADWMGDNGVQWQVETECYGTPGLCWESSEAGGFEVRASQVTLDFCREQAQTLGVRYLASTPATALVQDETGRVVGVRAEDESGEAAYYHATKAVVLSAGDMSHNKDMLARYAPTALRCLNATASPQNTGDGIRMGLGVGGVIAGYDAFMAFDGGMDWNGEWDHYLYSGDVQLVRQPWLGLNRQGERYPYWSLHDLQGGAAVMAGSTLLAQPEGHGYVFWDADFETNIKDFDEHMCRRPITPELADAGADLDRMPETLGPHNYLDGVNNALAAGVIKQADTIEGLAEQLGFDPEVLVAQVDAWNAMCDAGEDPVFGYKANWLKPIQNPPFYGAAVGATILNVSTGLKVNADMQVVSETGGVVEGLYAAGCNAGGQVGTTNNGMGGSPGGVMWSAASGYIAACSIAGQTE